MPKTDRPSPLFKRIKRHVIGRSRDYFAVSPPGFEAQALHEISALSPRPETINTVSGGVEFTAKLEQCWQANLCLRTVNRVLMRVEVFKAVRFDQLTDKLAEIPWELYLFPGQKTEYRISTAHCRLHHTGAIAERCDMAIKSHFSDPAVAAAVSGEPPHSAPIKIFIRGADDRFTVSIDSSGDILYKRGIKTSGGKAPIRETLAAAILMQAGYEPGLPLIDPMCGLGTFSLEAALMAGQTPPGRFRSFGFMNWPSFQPKRWEHLKAMHSGENAAPDAPLIFASDKDEKQIQAVENSIQAHQLEGWIQPSCKDFFSFIPEEVTKQRGLVVINPPYGVRIGSRKESRELFGDICRHLKKHYKGWRAALIVPEKSWGKAAPFRPCICSFSHGGLSLQLFTGRILS